MMRIVLLIGLLLAVAPALAATGYGWVIAANDVELELHSNGDLLVTETITADFKVEKHGIIRKLPTRYAVGMHQYALRFRLLGVTDGQGRRYQTKVSSVSNGMVIRIGDPDRTLRGRHVYEIKYRIGRAFLGEDDRVVLRWNAIGHEWDVPSLTGSVVVRLPEGVAFEEIVSDAWTGSWGSRDRDYQFTRDADGSLVYELGELRAREGMTLSVSLPASAISRPPWLLRLVPWLVDNFAYLLFPLVAAVCYWTWRRRGRDLPGAGSIAVQYDPPDDLTPAEVGTLIDEQVNSHDITATIISFATRGYLTMNAEPGRRIKAFNRCTLTKVRRPDDLKRHEVILFDRLFANGDSVKLKNLRKDFHLVIPTLKSALYTDLTKGGYFDGNPEYQRSTFLAVGLLVVLFLYAAGTMVQLVMYRHLFPLPLIVSAVLSIATVVGTSRVIPRRTSKGRRAWEHIAGLEEYIRRAEASTIVAAEKRGVFEKLLPYAMIFGLSDAWADAFAGIYETPPDWYGGHDRNDFSLDMLMGNLGRISSEMQNSLLTPPRSSGGGGWSSGGSSGGWSNDGFSGGGWSSGGFSGGGGGGGGSSGGGFGGGGGSSW